MRLNTEIGNVDIPIDPFKGGKDLLNVQPYIQGISDFILSCATPMTIAIQGDWGTGKTSMMNMIKHTICGHEDGRERNSEVHTIWFNTWQYSQFNMAESLPLSLLSYLVDKVCSEDKDQTNRDFLIKTVRKLSILSIKAGISLAGLDASEILNADQEKIINFAEEIEHLKERFMQAVNRLLIGNNKKRLVIFIDDLDRLNPETAVEVLEVLKIFLDVEQCVYVLAVDYEVVTQGITKKFGENVATVKGRSFFDKMIQLPFKMPVPLFKLDDFLKEQLQRYGMNSPKQITKFKDLIKGSIGSNPRTMKRLFNSYHLLSNIIHYDDNSGMNDYQSELLFAILCMQMAYEPLYEYFIQNDEWTDPNAEDMIFRADIQAIIHKLSVYDESIELKYASRLQSFLRILSQTIHNGIALKETDILSESELENFEHVLNYSSITSTNKTTEEDYQIELPTLSEHLNLTEYKIKGSQYLDSKIKYESGFTAAFINILEEIGNDPVLNEKFKKLRSLNSLYKTVPERFFNFDPNDERFKSSIKHIKSMDIQILTNYSSQNLKSILLKLLSELSIPVSHITLYGSPKNQPA